MTTTRRIVAVVCTVIALAACAGPACAGTMNLNGNGSYVESPPTHAQVQYTSSGQAATPAIVHVTEASGFDWGDAAIGAAAGIAIAALLVGGGLTLAQHRQGGVRHA
ncbi:MAG TPA: hypothetical protein VGH56_11970 [Solirubrobacteraceae bacterium]